MSEEKPNVIHALDSNKPYTLSAKGEVPIIEVELEGTNGLRVLWNDKHYNAKIETKHEDGEWYVLPGVQSIEILLSVDNPLPQVKINQIIVPGIRGRKISSAHIDEMKED